MPAFSPDRSGNPFVEAGLKPVSTKDCNEERDPSL